MKKSTKPARPGGSTPPDTRSMKVSSGVTVLGPKPFGVNSPILQRKPLTDAQIKELKAMITKAETAKAKAAAEKKINAKIIKKQNKPKSVKGGSSKPKPVIQVKPRGRIGGMLGGGSLTSRTK